MADRFLKFIFNLSMLSSYRKRTFQTEAGQGIIEYVLVLVLTVVLVLALSRGVAEPIVKHLQTKVLDLVGCMLRVGELPHIAFDLCGGDEALSLDFEGALASVNSGGSSTADSNNNTQTTDSREDNSNRNENTNRGNDNNPDVRDQASNGSLDGGGGGRGRGSGGRNSGDNGFFDDESGDTKFKIDSEEPASTSSFEGKFPTETGQTVVVTKVRREQQVGGSFSLISDEEEKENETQSSGTSRVKISSSNDNEAVRKVSSFKVEDNAKTNRSNMNNDQGGGFSLFKFIKWGLIIAIIVIFLLFSLTQLNNIRKGWTE